MRVAFKNFLAHFFDVLILNTKFENYENMGSKISVQDIDQKASDFAKANFMKQLKEHHQNLEKENKELKAQIKEWEIERDELLRECVKLAKLVEELRDAIEEPKELDDK
mgnify:FL=1